VRVASSAGLVVIIVRVHRIVTITIVATFIHIVSTITISIIFTSVTVSLLLRRRRLAFARYRTSARGHFASVYRRRRMHCRATPGVRFAIGQSSSSECDS
jgi:cbb3-type cytochrome oxidase subunit 3